MTDNNKDSNAATVKDAKASNDKLSELNNIDNLSHYLKSAAGTREGRAIPPLENWHPEQIDDMDLVIKANGEWWHEGRPITRDLLVDLFSKVLWAQTDEQNQVRYFLKTPAEKWQIKVENAPLLVTQVDVIASPQKDLPPQLQFTTRQGDVVVADAEHPIRLGLPFFSADSQTKDAQSQANLPYVLVRQNGTSALYALIHRNVFYHLVELGTLVDTPAGTCLRLKSGSSVFELTMAADA